MSWRGWMQRNPIVIRAHTHAYLQLQLELPALPDQHHKEDADPAPTQPQQRLLLLALVVRRPLLNVLCGVCVRVGRWVTWLDRDRSHVHTCVNSSVDPRDGCVGRTSVSPRTNPSSPRGI